MRGHIRQRAKDSWSIKIDIGKDPVTQKRVSKWYVAHGGRRAAERELARIVAAINAVQAATADSACDEELRHRWILAAIDAVRGSKHDAEGELARVIEKIRDGQPLDPSKLTVRIYLGQWLTSIQPSVSPKTFERYQEIVKRHLVPALGDTLLRRLSSLQIEAYYAQARAGGSLRSRPRPKAGEAAAAPAGLSARTVRHHHRILSQALRKAVEAQPRLLNHNPAKGAKAPKPERQEIRALDDAEIKQLLAAAQGTALRQPVLLDLTTGLRRGELLGLRWKDIDLAKGTLTVAQSLEQTKDGLRFKPPKTKSSRRSITLPPVIVEMLRRHRTDQTEARLKIGLGRDPDGLVFTRADGEPIVPDELSKSFVRLARRARLDGVTLHGLRHTHITQLLGRGVPLKVVSERAGHSSVAFTLDVYGHVLSGMQDQATAAIQEAFRGVSDL